MEELIASRAYIIELTPVKQKADKLLERLETFRNKYHQVIEAGHCVSIPDNPMGHLAFQCTELIEEFSLPVPENRVLCHLNTFHTREDIDSILESCRKLGIRNVLIISGDGSDRLPRLKPEHVGADTDSVTSIELAKYVSTKYNGTFNLGVAFNQYEPREYEFEKLDRKIDAGARFVITQPVVGREEVIEKLREYEIPVFLEAWMSTNTNLLADAIGYDIPPEYEHEPLEVLKKLVKNYPDCGFYTALLKFKSQFPELDGIWGRGE